MSQAALCWTRVDELLRLAAVTPIETCRQAYVAEARLWRARALEAERLAGPADGVGGAPDLPAREGPARPEIKRR